MKEISINTIQIKHYDKKLKREVSTEYAPVSERIKYFRGHDNYKGWSLTTEILKDTDKEVLMRAVIKDQFGIVRADGIAKEKTEGNFINAESHYENCQTSAWGRALANIGIGITDEIAGAEELQNAQENFEPASDDQRKEITKLLYTSTATGAQKARIKNEMFEYTPDKAQECINWLNSVQNLNPLEAGKNADQRDVKRKLKEKMEDPKA